MVVAKERNISNNIDFIQNLEKVLIICTSMRKT